MLHRQHRAVIRPVVEKCEKESLLSAGLQDLLPAADMQQRTRPFTRPITAPRKYTVTKPVVEYYDVGAEITPCSGPVYETHLQRKQCYTVMKPVTKTFQGRDPRIASTGPLYEQHMREVVPGWCTARSRSVIRSRSRTASAGRSTSKHVPHAHLLRSIGPWVEEYQGAGHVLRQSAGLRAARAAGFRTRCIGQSPSATRVAIPYTTMKPVCTSSTVREHRYVTYRTENASSNQVAIPVHGFHKPVYETVFLLCARYDVAQRKWTTWTLNNG